MEKFNNFPLELRKLEQWVLWDKVWLEKEQRWTKVPKQRNGSSAEADNKNTWCSFEEAIKNVYSHTGVGFVFVENIVGIDLDNCIQDDGELKDWAKLIVEKFPGYIEYSPSKRGLHIFFRASVSIGRKKDWKNDKGEKEGIECYSTKRFFTVTGEVYKDYNDVIDILEEEFNNWAISTFPVKKTFTVLPVGEKRDDNDILNRIRLSRNGNKFQVLYDTGDWQTLGFPSQSEADMSLCSLLMFFCGNNSQQVDSLFRQGKLFRPKWDEYRGAETYGQMTLKNGIREKTIVWDDSSSDDQQDMLKSVKLYGDITVEKTNIGYNIRCPDKTNVIHFFISEISVSRQSIEVILKVIIKSGTETSSPVSQRIDIRSNNAQSSLVTLLNKAYNAEGKEKGNKYNWALIINNVFTALGERIGGETAVQYLTGLKYEEPKFLLYPFLQDKAPNLLFAQSESGKGWLVIRMLVSIVTGIPIFGYSTEQKHKVLYIDYEDTAQVFASRLHRICVGLDLEYDDIASKIPYINLEGSVRDNIEVIRRLISKEEVSLVVYDAGGDAAGGSPIDEKVVIDFFNCIKGLNITNLVIHHEPKRVEGLGAGEAIYGSMYWKGRARVAWRLQKEKEVNGQSVVKMSQGKKSNLGKLDDIYYQINYESKTDAEFQGRVVPKVTFEQTEAETNNEATASEAHDDDRILEYLTKQPGTYKDIVQWTGQSERYTQNRLRALFEAGKVDKEEVATGYKSNKKVMFKIKQKEVKMNPYYNNF